MADEGSDGSFALLTPRRAYGSFISMRIRILIPGGDEEDKEPEPRWICGRRPDVFTKAACDELQAEWPPGRYSGCLAPIRVTCEGSLNILRRKSWGKPRGNHAPLEVVAFVVEARVQEARNSKTFTRFFFFSLSFYGYVGELLGLFMGTLLFIFVGFCFFKGTFWFILDIFGYLFFIYYRVTFVCLGLSCSIEI